MTLVRADSKSMLKAFFALPRAVYSNNPWYRHITNEYVRILLSDSSPFRKRADAEPFAILDESGSIHARFLLVRDRFRPGIIAVSAFEALPGIPSPVPHIFQAVEAAFPAAGKLVVGLNGHLNYGGGILLDRYEEPPLYDTNYNPPYYPGFFRNLSVRKLSTFRFAIESTKTLAGHFERTMSDSGIRIRPFDRNRTGREIALYTRLNNDCFADHELWTSRNADEDIEMFSHIIRFLEPENLLFAEKNGRTVGFLFWLPDFNRSCRPWHRTLPASLRVRNKAKACGLNCRLYEIAVLPGQRNGPVLPLLLASFARAAAAAGFRWCEGGFILESNGDSIATAERYIRRLSGSMPVPYRNLALYYAEKGDPVWN